MTPLTLTSPAHNHMKQGRVGVVARDAELAARSPIFGVFRPMLMTRWREQCTAARSIKEQFGSEKALGYLVGEKFLDYLRTSDCLPTLRDELPLFVAEIREVFELWELREYLCGARQVGATAHTLTETQYDEMQAAGALGGDVVGAAEDVILIERAKRVLLTP